MERNQQAALKEHAMSRPSDDQITHMSSLPSGTVLYCAHCDMGIYMTTKTVERRGTFEGAVKALADAPEYKRGSAPKKCPFCNTEVWWYPPGCVYTLQYGWVE